MKSYKEWYSCDGLITDRHSGMEMEGHPMASAGYVSVLNPNSEETADVTITFYHQNVEPTYHKLNVPPQQTEVVEVHNVEASGGRNRYYGLKVEADIPVIAQHTTHEYKAWDRVPEGMISVVMYSGPLKDETEWYFPDSWMGGGGKMSWYERETMTILNPNPTDAEVAVTFYLDGKTGTEKFTIHGQRVYPLWLFNVEHLGLANGKRSMSQSSMRVTSDLPIVVQKTRKAYLQFDPTTQGMWTSIGIPAHPENSAGETYTEWWYPGGYVQDVGNYPKDDDDQLGWDLYFMFNPSADKVANVDTTFYYESADPKHLEVKVEPLKHSLLWLHREQYREYTGRNQPYGVRISSDIPVFPHWTRGEYESWGEHCPTAMFGVVPYRGPLKDETKWYYADGFVQDDETHPLIQTEWISILNPNDKRSDVKLIIYTQSGPVDHQTEVDSQSVKLIKLEELEIVPKGQRYGVCVESTLPVVVQQTRRSLVKGGTPSSKSTFATMAVPVISD